MDDLPNFGLANTITGFATLFSGMTCLALSRWIRPQPPAWQLVWWLVVVTGVFTVTLHGFGETAPIFGPRWFWAFLDTGSNIVVAWGVARVALVELWPAEVRRRGGAILTAAMLIGVAWHFVDRLPGTERAYLIPLGDWGGFYPGETWLIAMSMTAVALFAAQREQIPGRARPLLAAVVVTFLVGMGLATASNDKIVAPFFSLHALWHLVSAFGFVLLWGFSHVCVEEREAARPAI